MKLKERNVCLWVNLSQKDIDHNSILSLTVDPTRSTCQCDLLLIEKVS